jgi:hypothetical protein
VGEVFIKPILSKLGEQLGNSGEEIQKAAQHRLQLTVAPLPLLSQSVMLLSIVYVQA